MSSQWIFPGYTPGASPIGAGFPNMNAMWQFPANNQDVLNLNLKRRDIVAAWRPNVHLFEPALIPTTVPLVYSVTIEGRTFQTTQQVGASLTDIAEALELVLRQEQTIVKVFRSDESLLFYGKLGQTLTVVFNVNLLSVMTLDAISVGEPGFMHVITARRHFTVERMERCEAEILRVRRAISGPVNVEGHPALISTTPFLDLPSADVATVIAREEFIP